MILELKNIAPYLPYGLKAALTVDKREEYAFDDWVDEANLEKFNKGCIWQYAGYADGDLSIPLGEGDLNGFILRNENTYTCFNGGIKPILRQLSDLTKDEEFEQFCKEQIICANLMVTNSGILIKVEVLGGSDEVIAIGNDIASECPYLFYSWLIEHHYDISGLIKEGLAINMNTIEP